MTTEVRPRPARALLRERVFRRYWSAHVVSLVGDQISLLAIPLLAVLTIGAGAAEMGYLTAAALLRCDRRRNGRGECDSERADECRGVSHVRGVGGSTKQDPPDEYRLQANGYELPAT